MTGERGVKRFYPMLILATLTASALFFWFGRDVPIKQMPDTLEAEDAYLCMTCGHTARMTPRKRALWIREKGVYVTRGGDSSGGQTSVRVPHFACPECGQMTLMRAGACDACGKVFRDRKCPACEATDKSRPSDRPKKKSRR